MGYDDKKLQLVLVVLLWFLVLNFDFTVSSVFLYGGVISLLFYIVDTFVSFPTERPGGGRGKELAVALGAYGVFVMAATVIVGVFAGLVSATGSAFAVFNENLFSFFASATPILSDASVSPFVANLLSLAVWGVLIPLIETDLFFGRLFEFGTEQSGIKSPSLRDFRTWAVLLIVASVFMVFHLTAKGITNNEALLMTLLFGIASLVLVVLFKQTIEAKLLHVTTNMVALVYGIGAGATVPAMIVVGVLLFAHFYPDVRRFIT